MTRSGGVGGSGCEPQLSRRTWLVAAPGLALAAVGAIACKKAEPASCNDTTGLSGDEVATRARLGYLDRCPDPERACDRCTQWIDATSAESCGGCKVMKGPVHPSGTCNVFARRA